MIADQEIANAPVAFLRQLQTAMLAPTTPPLSPAGQRLSSRFNRLFDSGRLGPAKRAEFIRGAQAAHALILANYLTHTNATNWITFTNICDWGHNYLDRDGITEFCQYCNSHSTAAYYDAFKDGSGAPLNAGTARAYVLTFAKDQIPQAKRFWSLTAYLPSSITLVPNSARKYVVASYTPGLRTNPDGSLSIFIAPRRPKSVPMANWLPAPRGPFNVLLRVYGPEGSVADNSYVPPGIKALP